VLDVILDAAITALQAPRLSGQPHFARGRSEDLMSLSWRAPPLFNGIVVE